MWICTDTTLARPHGVRVAADGAISKQSPHIRCYSEYRIIQPANAEWLTLLTKLISPQHSLVIRQFPTADSRAGFRLAERAPALHSGPACSPSRIRCALNRVKVRLPEAPKPFIARRRSTDLRDLTTSPQEATARAARSAMQGPASIT